MNQLVLSILLDVGCEQLPMFYTKRHLHDALKPKGNTGESIHYHGLNAEQIKKMPMLLENPVIVYDSLSRNDSIIIVTSELDNEKMPIIDDIKPNGKAKYDLELVESNFVMSFHGRNNFENQINRAVEQDKVLYYNKEKSQELFSVLGLQLSKGLNILDSNVIIHQGRNIVKGMQKENNAEQLSFFENLTLEDTEVEIPFAVGDEIDYGERYYTISKIDKEKNTVTLLDYNTGWYPISHDEDLSMVIAEFEVVREKEIVESEALATKPNNFVKIDDEGSVNSGSLSENFVITDEQIGVGGSKQKFNRNVTAIQQI